MSWGILLSEGSEQHIMKDKHQPAYILSRSAAEKLLQDGFPRNTFVISFYDPPSKRTGQVSQPPDYSGMPPDVFMCLYMTSTLKFWRNTAFPTTLISGSARSCRIHL